MRSALLTYIWGVSPALARDSFGVCTGSVAGTQPSLSQFWWRLLAEICRAELAASCTCCRKVSEATVPCAAPSECMFGAASVQLQSNVPPLGPGPSYGSETRNNMEQWLGDVVESKAQSKLCGSTCQQGWRARLNPLIVLHEGKGEQSSSGVF